MAHVKVVRRSMRPEEWTLLRFSWLRRGVYADMEEITDITIRDARQISENEYEFTDGPERPLRRGELYFTPDGTAFIRMKTRVPERMKGKNLCLQLKTAAEMIVKINGRYAGGIDPNRERIPLDFYNECEELDIEIEAYNRSKPDDERNPESLNIRGCRQVFNGAFLCLTRDNVQSLIYDCVLLTDIAQSEYFDENLRSFLFAELSHALDRVDFDTWEGVDAAAEYIRSHIYENTDYKGTGNVALVGHSHLDIAYYWRRIHAVQKNARTILIQLRLMDRYPEFRYTHTQAYTYETLEKYYPEIFEELKQKVAEGRFEPVGAMYVEPDCNVPAAESLIRQFLYGQLFFRRAFGRTIDNAWLPDVFGNSSIMPQILKKSCVDYFVSNKMSTWNDTNRFPHNHFIWKGLDGSTVYACVPPTHFITWNMPSQIRENWEAYQDKDGGGATLSMYGYGDGGSGVTEEMMEMIRRFPRISAMPKCEVTGGADFLHKNLGNNPNLAVWDGELYLEMHRGTFTTKSDIKKANRLLEFMLRDAEIASVLRYPDGAGYPSEEIRTAYKKLLLNQFHDILPGSHIHPVYEDAMEDYRKIKELLTGILGEKADAPYFNSLNFPRSVPVFIPSPTGSFERHGLRGAFARVDAAGLATGRFVMGDDDTSWLSVSSDGEILKVATPFYRATLRSDGSFVSLYDNKLRREWVREGHGFNKLHLYGDYPGMYDAWDILPNYRDVEYPFETASPLCLTTLDGFCAEFETVLRTGRSSWKMRVRFFRDFPGIEVEHIADWHEKHRLCKVNFAPDILTREVVCDTSAGFIRREWTKNTSWQTARFEVCHHKWFDLSETGAGLAVINEGKYGLGLEEEEVSLSLLRATIRPDIESDMGLHDFCVMILPHEGDAVAAEINRRSLEYNVSPRRTGLSFPEPLRSALCSSSLILQAMKLSEDGKSFILRLSEQDGRRGEIVFPSQVRLLNMLEDVTAEGSAFPFRPFEILTFALPLA